MRRNVRSWAWGALLALGAQGAWAQAVPYEITLETASYNPLTGGGVTRYTPSAYVLGFGAWDEGVAAIPLPFSFSWFGRPHDTVYVYTNGFLSFQPPPSPTLNILAAPSLVPDPRTPVHDFIAPLWQDLEGGNSPEIRASFGGAAPNRRAIIEVTGLRRARTPGSSVAFQVRLEEQGSAIVSYDPAANNGVTLATIGIEDAQGVLGASLFAPSPSCMGGCVCGPRACSSSNVTLPNPSEARAIAIRPPMQAELIGAIDGPSGAYPGDRFDAGLRVSNVGLGAAGASTAELRLSTDTTIDASDRLLGTVPVPALAGGGAFSSTISLTMPLGLPVGRFYLGVLVDTAGVVAETVEGNNAARDPEGIVTGPDLTAVVAVGPASGPGETLDLVFGLRSRGAPWTQAIGGRFLLSEDATLDANDRELLSTSFTLPDGFTLDRTVPVTVPNDVTPRAYRVIAVVDPMGVVSELDETNNVAVSPGNVTMSLPDLEPTELLAGPVAFRGLPYALRTRITNRGGAIARTFTVCAVISRNPLISTVSDPILARTPPITVGGGETAAIRLEPVIPTDTGTGAYYLAIVADCDEGVIESAEPNNTRRRMDPITVMDPAPDLLPVAIRTASAAAAGEPLLASLTIGNYGPAPGAARVRLLLSESVTASPSDRVIYDGPMPVPLEPARELVLGIEAEIPGDVPSGRYYVGAILDPNDDVAEVDETNNLLTGGGVVVLGGDLAIVSPAPPNGVLGVRYLWRFYAGGGDPALATTWTARWDRQPAGLAFDPATAELSGTPTEAGTFALEIEATRGGLVARASYRFLVTPPTLPLSIVSSKLPPALQGEPYPDTQLVAVGGQPPYRWRTVTGSRPPPGLSLSQDGVLSGTPAAVDAYVFEVEVEDALGAIERGELAMDVIDVTSGLSIGTVDLPSGAVGEAFDVPFTVQGGTAPYTWRMTGDVPGLALGADAHLSGTPSVAGSYALTIEVRDARGLLDRNAYVLRIFELGELAIVTGRSAEAQLPRAKLGEPYSNADGSPVVLRAARRSGAAVTGLEWLLALGELPPGLRLDMATGTLEGTPTAPGTFAFTVLAYDDTQDRDRATLVIVVESPETAPPPVDEGCGCTSAPRDRSSSLLALGLLVALLLRRRAGALAALALTGASSAEAQPIPYTVTRAQAPYARLGAATRVTPELGDGGVFRLALPFEVGAYGARTRELAINANGVVFFAPVGAGQHYPPRTIPDPAQPSGFVAGLWGDWCSGLGCGGPAGPPDAGVYYAIDATPGAGRVTIEYRGLRHFADFTAASDINLQIALFEGPAQRIELHYGPIVPGQSFGGQPTSLSARIGVESPDGRSGAWIAPCDGALPCDNAAIVGLEGTRLTLLADAGEDVALVALAVPEVVYPGLSARVDVRYESRHGAPLGPARVAVYLVEPTASSTVGGLLLALGEPLVLAPYESRMLSIDAPIPADLAPARRAFMVLADAEGALLEPDETNNLMLSPPVRVGDRAPDLAVTRLAPASATLPRGARIDFAYRVENRGNAPASASAQLFLSRNAAVTPTDVPLGAPLALSLGPAEVATGTISAEIVEAASPGEGFVALLADPLGLVEELDESNNASRAAPVRVTSDELAFVTNDLPVAVLTASYLARIEAVGGDRAPTLRLTSGALPRGLAFDAAERAIFGVPLEGGSFPLGFEATSGARRATVELALTVVRPELPLTVLTHALPVATLGSDYAALVRVVGGTPPYVFGLEGALPRGVDLAFDGALVGAPRESGAFPFTFLVHDAAAATATIGFALEVRLPVNLTALEAELPAALVGQPYSARVQAAGGRPPYRWSAASALPTGLALTEIGELVGTPVDVGAHALVLRVEDAAGAGDTNGYALAVEPRARLAIVVEKNPKVTVGAPFRALLRADGGAPPFAWSVLEDEGALPPGVVAHAGEPTENESTNDLALSGVIAEAGAWAVTIRLRDAHGLLAERPLAIESVAPPPPTPPEDGGCRCVAAQTSASPAGAVLGLLTVVALGGRRRRGPPRSHRVED